MRETGNRAFALPVVLVAVIVFAVIGMSAMGLFMNRGDRLKTTYAQTQAQLAAEGAFNWALGKLAQAPMAKRWFAQDTSAHLIKEVDGSLLDVFLCDVFNASGQLTHVHIIARCQRAIDVGFRQTCAIVFGSVQVSGEDDELTATVLSRQTLIPSALRAFIEVNVELFSSDKNPFAKKRRVSLSASTYASLLPEIQNSLKHDELSEIDFSDGQTMRSYVALLERYLELKRELLLARAANEMLRDASIADVLRLASETNLPLDDLLETLRAIQSQGPKLTAERAGELAGQLSRSQRELLIIYLLLQRLAKLPTGSSVDINGKKRTPSEAAKLLGKLLFKKIMGSETEETSLAKIFDKLLAKGKKLDEQNIFRTFFKIVNQAKFCNKEGTEQKLPFRDQCIELARVFEPESSRIPFNSTGEDVWQDKTGNTKLEKEPTGDDDDDDNEGTRKDNVDKVQMGPISKHGFERSISGLGLYEEDSVAYEHNRANIENYIRDLVDSSGNAGYQEAALQAGLLGMNEEQSAAFGEILQDMVTAAGIRWMTLNVPSPLTESNHSPIALDVSANNLDGIKNLPSIDETVPTATSTNSSGSSGSASETPLENNEPTTMETNYGASENGGSELWVTVGTAVSEPIVGPTPPPPPPPPAPPPSASGGGSSSSKPSTGGGSQPSGGGSQPSGGGTITGTPPPTTDPASTSIPTFTWGSGGDDDDDSGGDDDDDDSG